MPKFLRVLITLAVVGGFLAMLWMGAAESSRVRCELCIDFKGRTECRAGQGEDEAAAIESARMASCAVMTSGVTEAFKCNAVAPSTLRCEGP